MQPGCWKENSRSPASSTVCLILIVPCTDVVLYNLKNTFILFDHHKWDDQKWYDDQELETESKPPNNTFPSHWVQSALRKAQLTCWLEKRRRHSLGTTAPSRHQGKTGPCPQCPFQIPKYGEGLGFGRGTECSPLKDREGGWGKCGVFDSITDAWSLKHSKVMIF